VGRCLSRGSGGDRGLSGLPLSFGRGAGDARVGGGARGGCCDGLLGGLSNGPIVGSRDVHSGVLQVVEKKGVAG
jgi:hypothetical protein